MLRCSFSREEAMIEQTEHKQPHLHDLSAAEHSRHSAEQELNSLERLAHASAEQETHASRNVF